jgi:hypothetical protein
METKMADKANDLVLTKKLYEKTCPIVSIKGVEKNKN